MNKKLTRPLLQTTLASGCIALALVPILYAQSFGPNSQAPPPAVARETISELTAMVEQYGWEANMSRMCVAFRLGPETECRFKQIALSGSGPGTIDNHGFNVPTTN